MKALILDNIEDICKEILQTGGITVHQKNKLSKEELLEIVKDYEIILVRSATKITSEVIARATKLRLVGRAGAGVDNIDVDACTHRGVLVMNTPGGNTISAAEYTCGMILSSARLIPQAHQETKEKLWDRKKWMGAELDGKTLAVIGLGKIGQEVSKRMISFGMNIIAYDPMVPEEYAQKIGVTLGSLERCFEQADFITLHTPLNDATKDLISKTSMTKMKNGVRIVNCARGGVVNENDLVEALTSGKVAAAAMDVFSNEPIKQDSSLLTAPNLIMTPHIAASTVEAQSKVAVQISNQIIDWQKKGDLVGLVNGAALGVVQNVELQAFLKLAESIGSFHAQYEIGHPKKITVYLTGSLLGKFSDHITAASLKGILRHLGVENVTHTNSIKLAKEKGIHVETVKEKVHQDYTDLLRIKYETATSETMIGGIVIGKKDERIVMIDDFTCEVKIEKHLLVYTNQDKPGVIARVGMKLLRVNKNISNISLSRNNEKTQALTIIALDNDIDNDFLRKIEEVDGVYHPRIIRL